MKMYAALALVLVLIPACDKKKKDKPLTESRDLVVNKESISPNEEILVKEGSEAVATEEEKAVTPSSPQEQKPAENEAPAAEKVVSPRFQQALKTEIVCGEGQKLPSFHQLGDFLKVNKMSLQDFTLTNMIDNRAYAAFDNTALIWYQATDSKTGMVRQSIAALKADKAGLVLASTFLFNSETNSYIELGEASLDEQQAHVVCIAK